MRSWQDRLLDVLAAETDNLQEIARLAGYNPRVFYRGANFRNADLTKADLASVDLTKADLRHAILRPAQISQLVSSGADIRVSDHQSASLGAVGSLQDQVEDKIDEILRRLGGAKALLAVPDALKLEELRALAASFGEVDAASKAELVEFIKAKRREHEAFVAEINAINEQTAGLGNLKAAAKAAAENLDYAEVENLLARVDEVETEVAAQTKELRADNALLRGRVEEAYRLLNAAAETLDRVDRSEGAKRVVVNYSPKLFYHALRYGGPGFDYAVGISRRYLSDDLAKEDPILWGTFMHNMARSLGMLGSRLGGEAAQKSLGEAVKAFHLALRVRTEEDHPVEWAETQMNLGKVLQVQGARRVGKEGVALLSEAVLTLRAALRVCTENTHPVDWAATQSNLGTALRDQGTRTGGAAGAALLSEAVAAYRAALRVQTEADHPVDWAGTQNNLGVVLQSQGSRIGGEAGAALLAEAVAAYRAALRVQTEADYPVDWAMTMENVALAEQEIAAHENCNDPAPHLRAALEALTAALRVFDPEHMPYNFEKATALKAHLEAKLAGLEGCSD